MNQSPEHRSEDSEGEGVISLQPDIPGELPYTLDRGHDNERQIAEPALSQVEGAALAMTSKTGFLPRYTPPPSFLRTNRGPAPLNN